MTMSCTEKIAVVVLAVIGIRILIRVSVIVWKKLIAPNLGLGIDLTSQGRWAVITGATDGIGKAYAEHLAKKGLDIVLISRSLSKLEDVAADIKQAYGVETRIIQADLTEGSVAYAKVAKATEELEIGVLVNNVGASYEHPEFFTDISEEMISKILQLNVAVPTGMSRVLLPKMVNRRKGVIINVSSAMALMPSPLLAVYSASKAYLDKLSTDLAAETAHNGVTVQCVFPGPVATKMSKIKKPTWMAPAPEKYVEMALKTVGIESRTTGYLPHALMTAVITSIRCICDKAAVWLVTKTTLNIRSRALKHKQAKLNERPTGEPSLVTEER